MIMATDQAALAADEAVKKMADLRSEVQRKREQDQKKVEELREQNKKMVEKAAAAYQAKKDGKTVAAPPVKPREEPKYTFFDTEDEYAVQDQPAPQAPPMPEFTPPPRPTPRRHARPAVDEDDDDYSNQSWMQ
jgi:hypothetical protein